MELIHPAFFVALGVCIHNTVRDAIGIILRVR